MELAQVGPQAQRVIDQVETVIVGKIETVTVEQHEARRRAIPKRWMAREKFLTEPQRRFGDIRSNHGTSQLRQSVRCPARAGAKLEHSHSRTQRQTLQYHGEVRQQLWRLVRSAEWLRQMVRLVFEFSEVFFCQPAMFFNRARTD